jgi:TonB family protein
VGIAVSLHLLTLVLAITLPMLLNYHRPLLDNVVTVNLVSLPDTGQEATQTQAEQQPAPETTPPPEPVPKVEPVKPKVQVAETPPVVQAEPVPVKQVSLKPVKRKLKKVDEKLLQQQKEQQRLKEIAQARQEEQKALREAERARTALAEMIRARGVQNPSSSSARGSSARQGVSNIVSQQYYMTVGAHMQQFWILPEMRQWDPRLETVVVLTILRDGTVAKVSVEQKSADPFFDQFVMQTIEKASPVPPFPKLMQEDSIELGFRFRPNEQVGNL